MSLDAITDFQTGIDKIDLSGIDANIGLTGDQAFHSGGSSNNKSVGELTFKSYTAVSMALKMRSGMDLDGDSGSSPYSGTVTVIFANVDGIETPDFALFVVQPEQMSKAPISCSKNRRVT